MSSIPNHYECLKMMRDGMMGLYVHASNTLKERYNMNIYNKLLHPLLLSSAIIVPDYIIDNEEMCNKIQIAVASIFKKFHFKVINDSWKKSDMYIINHDTYVISCHYYFELVPYYNMNYSEVYQKDYIFGEYPSWYVKEIKSEPNITYIYATLVNISELD
jgi:hypothetical protein